VLFRWPAQVWQQNCNSFCHYLQGNMLVHNDPNSHGSVERVEGDFEASVVVHVKFVCHCAVELMPVAKHILDVVDTRTG